MDFVFTVKITAGPRSETKVRAEARNINLKEIKFKNSALLSDEDLTRWIETHITERIGRLKNA